VPQIIEIHMELIDEFSKQLKLEGRNDEVLLDYRLTLIDILAHLCEVYRCSIPKQLKLQAFHLTIFYTKTNLCLYEYIKENLYVLKLYVAGNTPNSVRALKPSETI